MMPGAKRVAKGMWWDRAWRLVSGCTEVSQACDNCWAAREAHMRSKHPIRKIADHYRGLTHLGHWNGEIREEWDTLRLSWARKKPTVWAVWNDLYHPAVSWNFLYRAYEFMWTCPRHLFFVLTKRPERMEKNYAEILFHFRRNYPGVDFPRNNVIHGTTVENQYWADIRIPELLKIPGLHFVSVEPMLGPVYLGYYFSCYLPLGKTGIDWVICGAESGPGARPMDINWAVDLKNQCIEAGEPFWMKQMVVPHKSGGYKLSHNMNDFIEELRLREWPEALR